MTMILYYLAIGLNVVGAVLTILSFLMLAREKRKKSKEVYDLWLRGEIKELGARAIVSIVIWVVIAILSITAALYGFDKTEGGLSAVMNYLSFAGPCMGALFVGLGILAIKRDVQEPLGEIDFRYYFIGIPFLLLGYVGFVVRNPSHIVNLGIWIMSFLAFSVPLIVLRTWKWILRAWQGILRAWKPILGAWVSMRRAWASDREASGSSKVATSDEVAAAAGSPEVATSDRLGNAGLIFIFGGAALLALTAYRCR